MAVSLSEMAVQIQLFLHFLKEERLGTTHYLEREQNECHALDTVGEYECPPGMSVEIVFLWLLTLRH